MQVNYISVVVLFTLVNLSYKMNFTKEEMVQIVYALGAADRNCLLASRIYKQRFPESRQPAVQTFEKVKTRFENSGSICYPSKVYVNRTVINEVNELDALLSLAENPHSSCRQIESQLNISKSSVNRIIKKHRYHPYHMSLHQELHGNDFENRTRFCNMILEKINQNPAFYSSVLFSDEATFKSNGLVNKHNMHYYATENPHWVRQIDFQNQWSLNVWGGIINNYVIGPFFLRCVNW